MVMVTSLQFSPIFCVGVDGGGVEIGLLSLLISVEGIVGRKGIVGGGVATCSPGAVGFDAPMDVGGDAGTGPPVGTVGGGGPAVRGAGTGWVLVMVAGLASVLTSILLLGILGS